MCVEATFYSIALVLKPAYTTATLLRFSLVDAYIQFSAFIVLLTYSQYITSTSPNPVPNLLLTTPISMQRVLISLATSICFTLKLTWGFSSQLESFRLRTRVSQVYLRGSQVNKLDLGMVANETRLYAEV